MKESELYQPVKELLQGKGYTVYAEVEAKVPGNWNARADVIGYNNPTICIVELKTSLSVELVEQAYKWLPHAHYVYVAIPRRKKDFPSFMKKLLHDFGIGVIEVDTRYGAEIIQSARFNRPRFKTDWSKKLLPEHQTWVEGGSSKGGHVTPYKLTILKVQQYLSRNPHRWFSMNEILDHCETHYANSKPSLSRALREFEQDWCETKVEKGKLYFRQK